VGYDHALDRAAGVDQTTRLLLSYSSKVHSTNSSRLSMRDSQSKCVGILA